MTENNPAVISYFDLLMVNLLECEVFYRTAATRRLVFANSVHLFVAFELRRYVICICLTLILHGGECMQP
jgi:hypothetical protein